MKIELDLPDYLVEIVDDMAAKINCSRTTVIAEIIEKFTYPLVLDKLAQERRQKINPSELCRMPFKEMREAMFSRLKDKL